MEVSQIRELLEARQLSPTQFADLIGVGRPVISHILSGRNEPSLKVVRSIIEAFPDVSLPWIMTGTGPMLAGTPPVTSTPPAPPTTTQSAASAAATVPIAQVQSVPPAETPATPVAPALAVPTPTTPIAAAPAPLLTAAAVPRVAQPTRLPQPPRFRPAVKVAPYSESAALATASAPVLPTSSIEALPVVAPPIAPPPAPISGPIAPPSDSIAPPPPIISVPALPVVEVPPVAPTYSATVESATLAPPPIPTPAPVPASPADALPSMAPNPAAAFSFLGEAGKTIRRIVLFYSDGSFSDYRPEGQ